jgi:hypothetical protein
MTSNNGWANRPRAREEMTVSESRSVPFLTVIFAFCFFVSAIALGVMFFAHVLHDAGAIDWTLSYRQSQVIALIFTLSRSVWGYVYSDK